MSPKRSAAVFLDRDGTLIRDVGYLCRLDQVEILPGGAEALKLLRNNGLKIVVVTNQSGVGRGFLSEPELHEIHETLIGSFAARGAKIDAIYYCPHHPTEGLDGYRVVCDCRKPNAGMLRRAAEQLHLDLGASYVVGDQATDMELAARVGAKGVWIHVGSQTRPAWLRASYVAADLRQAARWVIGNLRSNRRLGG
jgi:D-glycero-D-manno-heptose 1,7-bisphosphate phosphatase